MKRRELTFIITALILASVFGGLIGELVGQYLPAGAAKTLFTTVKSIGFDTGQIDLWAISFSFSLGVKINFVSVLMVILVIVYFRWWYF